MNLSEKAAAAAMSFAHEVGHLKRTPRTGWTLAGVRGPESVAEHSFRVGVLAYCIGLHEDANADHAAVLGLFHDVPETRIGDIPSVGKKYVAAASPHRVIIDQVSALDPLLASHIVAMVDEHESAKTTNGTLESRCSRDADKLECLLQAREYQREGYQQLDPWVTTMTEAMTTPTGKRLAAAALDVSPGQWWDTFAQNYGKDTA